MTTPGEVSLITCNRSTRLSRLQPGGRRCWARYGRRCWRLGRFLDELKCRQRFLLFDTGLCRNQESEVPIINLSPWQKVHTVVFLFQSIHLLLTKLAYEHRNHFEVTIRFDFDNYFYEIKTQLELLVVKLFNVTAVFLIEDCRFCTVEASNFEPCRNFSFLLSRRLTKIKHVQQKNKWKRKFRKSLDMQTWFNSFFMYNLDVSNVVPPITYSCTGLLILDNSYLVGKLTNSIIAETKALVPLKS